MRLVQKLAHDSSKEFAKVELKSKFSEMTFNTIMRMVSGKRYYGDDCDVTDVEEARQFREIIKVLVPLGGANNPGDFLAVLRWFDFDDLEKKLKRISKRTDAFLQGLIDEHRNGKQNAKTMIDHLLAQQQLHPEYYTDQIIKGLILVSCYILLPIFICYCIAMIIAVSSNFTVSSQPYVQDEDSFMTEYLKNNNTYEKK